MHVKSVANLLFAGIIMALPGALVIFAESTVWNAIAWFGWIAWMLVWVYLEQYTSARAGLFIFLIASGVFFDVAPASNIWGYVVAAVAIFSLTGAYREQLMQDGYRPIPLNRQR